MNNQSSSTFISLKELAQLIIELNIPPTCGIPKKKRHPLASGMKWIFDNPCYLMEQNVLSQYNDSIIKEHVRGDHSSAQKIKSISFIMHICAEYTYDKTKDLVTNDDIEGLGFSRKYALVSLQEYTHVKIPENLLNSAEDFSVGNHQLIKNSDRLLKECVSNINNLRTTNLNLSEENTYLKVQLESELKRNTELLDENTDLKSPNHPKSALSIAKIIAVLASEAEISLIKPGISYEAMKIKAEQLGIDNFPNDDTYKKWLTKAKQMI